MRKSKIQNPDLAFLLSEGLLKESHAPLHRQCPQCKYYTRANRKICPGCGFSFRQAKAKKELADSSVKTVAVDGFSADHYKRICRLTTKFAKMFSSREAAVEAISLASEILDLCGSLEEAVSWLEIHNDEATPKNGETNFHLEI